MNLIFKRDRDKEFFNICMKIKQGSNLSVDEVVQKAIETPASSFFLTAKAFERIIYNEHIVKGMKAELYKEVKDRYNSMNAKSVKKACISLECQTAPKFYISKARATTLYYDLVKQYNNEVRHRIDFYNRVFGI